MVCRAKEMDHKCHFSAGGALLLPHLPFVYNPGQLAATLQFLGVSVRQQPSAHTTDPTCDREKTPVTCDQASSMGNDYNTIMC